MVHVTLWKKDFIQLITKEHRTVKKLSIRREIISHERCAHYSINE